MGRPQLSPGSAGRVSVARQGGAGTTPGWSARCRVRDLDGTLHQLRACGATPDAARAALAGAVRARAQRSAAPCLPEEPLLAGVEATVTVADLAQAWLDTLTAPAVGAATRDLYRRSVTTHLLPRLGMFKVRLLNAAVVELWLTEVSASAGPASAKTARTCLRGMLAIAERERVVTGPLDVVPRPRVASTSARVLDVAEEGRLRAVLAGTGPAAEDPVVADLVLFLLETGCRVGEALALTWDRVDLEPGAERARVTATVERVAGQPTVARERDDSDGRRELGVPPTAAAMLRRRLAAKRRRHQGLVFPSRVGTVRDPANTAKRLRRFFDAAGLPGVVSHDLRATRAARPLGQGAPLVEVVAPLVDVDAPQPVVAPVPTGAPGRRDGFLPAQRRPERRLWLVPAR